MGTSKTKRNMEYDLLHIPDSVEQSRHKKKRMVQAPNSYFMNVKTSDGNGVSPVFSHSTTPYYDVVTNQVQGKVSGGKIRLQERCLYNVKKQDKPMNLN